MDAAASCVSAVAEATQLSVCGPGTIVEYHTLDNVSNKHDVDSAAVPATLPQEKEVTTNHESQIFVRTSNRTIALNVNLARDRVEEVERLIEEREGIPVSEQHLIFGGKPLRHGTSLRDYEALGDESTIDVIPRIRGGSRTTGDMTLRDLVAKVTKEAMVCDADIQYLDTSDKSKQVKVEVKVKVLTEVGRSIVHGVLTCILNAHRAGMSFSGNFGMDDHLRVHVYEGETKLVVSSVYVKADDGQAMVLAPLDGETQKKDYVTLKRVIHNVLFPANNAYKLMHVGSICKLLVDFTGALVDPLCPVKRTHLLLAYAAMVSSPVAVSTMCLNLKRFYDQLDENSHKLKSKFAEAMKAAQQNMELQLEIGTQPLFHDVYYYDPSQNRSDENVDSQYAGKKTGLEMFNFARNWFTHVPKERWDEKKGEQFEGLLHLDQIFTYHFESFIPQALLQLYMAFDDYNMITSVVVPLA